MPADIVMRFLRQHEARMEVLLEEQLVELRETFRASAVKTTFQAPSEAWSLPEVLPPKKPSPLKTGASRPSAESRAESMAVKVEPSYLPGIASTDVNTAMYVGYTQDAQRSVDKDRAFTPVLPGVAHDAHVNLNSGPTKSVATSYGKVSQTTTTSHDDEDEEDDHETRTAAGSASKAAIRIASRRTRITTQNDKKLRIKSHAEQTQLTNQATAWRSHTTGRKHHTTAIQLWIWRLTLSRIFESVVMFLILSNCVVIGLSVDHGMRNKTPSRPLTLTVLEACFAACFAIELAVRWSAQGAWFFATESKQFSWNVFDATVALCGVLDQALQVVASESRAAITIRVTRIFRLVRVLRIIRAVRFSQGLRILVVGVWASLQSLVWALLLLFVVAFIVGASLMELIVAEFASQEVSLETEHELMRYFGKLGRTVLSLYQSVTGGLDWSSAVEPLLDLNIFLGCVYVLYTAIAVLCVLNIVTGLSVENAKRVSQQDQTQFLVDHGVSRKRWLQEVKELFHRMADADTQKLHKEGFMLAVEDLQVQAYFKKLGIDVEHEAAMGLFDLLDFREDGVVDLDEFSLGVQMLHGSARSIDMARVRYTLGRVSDQLAELKVRMDGGRGSHRRGKCSGRQDDGDAAETHRTDYPDMEIIDS